MPDFPFQITIPMPLLVVVEDVGWWLGNNQGFPNEPYRTGMGRRHCPEDYHALVALAKELKTALLLGFVACEWDRENILAHVPSTTWMGSRWENRKNRGPWLDEAAHILKGNRQHLEIALHGVGHEYWEKGKLSRSEFHDATGNMRPPDEIRAHLDYFGRIMAQHNLGDFPQVFIPPALNHSFGNGPKGFQKLLNDSGISYVTTIFNRAKAHSPPHHTNITWECGVVLLERGEAPVPWNHISAIPKRPVPGPIMAIHWGNILHADPARNMEIVSQWVPYIKRILDNFDRIGAQGARSCWTQYAYRLFTKVKTTGKGFELDTSQIKKLPEKALDRSFFVRIRSPQNRVFHWKAKRARILSGSTDQTHHGERITTLGIQEAPPRDNPEPLRLWV